VPAITRRSIFYSLSAKYTGRIIEVPVGVLWGVAFMPSRRVASKYIALAHINPIVCLRCGGKARAVWHSPLPAGLEGELRTFECEDCGKKTKMIIEEKITADTEAI
jgi:hypothetical protein